MSNFESQISEQLKLSRFIRISGGVDENARNRNSYEYDANFRKLYTSGQIAQIIQDSNIPAQQDIQYSHEIINGCCCNSSEALHGLSLVKSEGILVGVRDKEGKIVVLGSLKANKEGTGLGEKNTLITWLNTQEVPMGTICSVGNVSETFSLAINKITKVGKRVIWPSLVILKDARNIFPLRLAYPLEKQEKDVTVLYEILLQKSQILAEKKVAGSFFELVDNVLISIKAPCGWIKG